MPEDGFYPEGHKQLFQFQRRRDPDTLKGTKHAVPVKAAVRHQNVTGGIKSEEVAKALNSNDCTGDGVVLMDRLLEKDLLGDWAFPRRGFLRRNWTDVAEHLSQLGVMGLYMPPRGNRDRRRRYCRGRRYDRSHPQRIHVTVAHGLLREALIG